MKSYEKIGKCLDIIITIVITLSVAISFIGMLIYNFQHNYYPDILTVENIHQDEDAIIFMNGEKYAYVYYGIDDLEVGDVVSAIMYNNKTEKLSDDKIIKINKSKFTKSNLNWLMCERMKHLGDITKISGFDVPPVDIVIGGSPCQDLSSAGKREGLAGARSGLFLEQIRLIKEMRDADKQRGRTDQFIRPRFMVWENVPGAFSSNQGNDFRTVLEETIRIAEPDAPDDMGTAERFGKLPLGQRD